MTRHGYLIDSVKQCAFPYRRRRVIKHASRIWWQYSRAALLATRLHLSHTLPNCLRHITHQSSHRLSEVDLTHGVGHLVLIRHIGGFVSFEQDIVICLNKDIADVHIACSVGDLIEGRFANLTILRALFLHTALLDIALSDARTSCLDWPAGRLGTHNFIGVKMVRGFWLKVLGMRVFCIELASRGVINARIWHRGGPLPQLFSSTNLFNFKHGHFYPQISLFSVDIFDVILWKLWYDRLRQDSLWCPFKLKRLFFFMQILFYVNVHHVDLRFISALCNFGEVITLMIKHDKVLLDLSVHSRILLFIALKILSTMEAVHQFRLWR